MTPVEFHFALTALADKAYASRNLGFWQIMGLVREWSARMERSGSEIFGTREDRDRILDEHDRGKIMSTTSRQCAHGKDYLDDCPACDALIGLQQRTSEVMQEAAPALRGTFSTADAIARELAGELAPTAQTHILDAAKTGFKWSDKPELQALLEQANEDLREIMFEDLREIMFEAIREDDAFKEALAEQIAAKVIAHIEGKK